MQNDSFEREYIVTYHTKSGRYIIETYDDYGAALYAAAAEMESQRDFRDWYEIHEITTTTKLIKSTKRG